LLSSPVCSGEQEVTYAGKGADRQKEDDMQQSRSLAAPNHGAHAPNNTAPTTAL